MASTVDTQVFTSKDEGRCRPSMLKGAPLVFPKHYPATLNEALHNAATTKEVIVFVDERGNESTLSYSGLLDRATTALGGLQQLGVVPGGKVILQLDELDEFLISFWACVLGGLVPVPVLPFRSADRKDSSFRKLQKIAAQLDSPVILMSNRNAESIKSAHGAAGKESGLLALNGRIATFGEIGKGVVGGITHAAQPEDLAFLQFTSGSTSFPKGTRVTHANVLATIHGLVTSLGVTRSSCLFNWMPYFHDMGIIAGHLMAVVSMCRVIAVKPFTFVRRPMLWLTKIHEHRVSITFSPNFGLKRILEKASPDQLELLDLSCLDVILNGAEPISVQTCNRFLDLLHTHCGLRKECLLAGYGLAEASLAVTIAPRGELFREHILNGT